MAECRSCGRPIVFGVTAKGKPMPLDAARTPDGQWLLDDSGRCYRATGDPPNGHRPHFATCPQAKRWRGSTRADQV